MSHLTKSDGNRRQIIIITALLLLTASLCCAQGSTRADVPERNDLPIFELGFMIPMLKASGNTSPGFGARAVFNPHPRLSVEIEANDVITDSGENRRNHPNGRDIGEVFDGVKSGYRFRHVGIFAKARPGYLSFVQFVRTQPLVVPSDPGSALNRRERYVRRPAFDLGLVFEFYLTRHWAIRTDVGDTMAFYNSRFPKDLDIEGVTRQNLQTGIAIQYRF